MTNIESNHPIWDLMIIGSGPNGLATALHAGERGLRALVLERGHLAESIAQFPRQMAFYGLAGDQELGGLPCDCPRSHPTREDMLSYLGRVVRLTQIDVREQTLFRGIAGADGDFTVLATSGGQELRLRTRKLVIATGVFGQPKRLEVPGAELPKVVYAYRDPWAYRRQRVAIVGAGNGAAEAALRLFREADAEVTVLNRGPALHPGKWRWTFPDLVELIEYGLIRMVHGATVQRIEPLQVVFSSPAGPEKIANDHVIVQIGYRPNTELFDSVGVVYDEMATPRIDPRTLETNIKGVYVAGNVATGAADLVLIRGGRNHCKAIVAHILGEEPLIQDLGVANLEHWLQFEALDEPLDEKRALELVPVVVGDFQYQWLDVYQLVQLRHREALEAQGVRPGDHWRYPLPPTPVMDALSDEHLQVLDDGSLIFKGQHFPGEVLDILRRADGTRRIRDIVREIDVLYAGKTRRLPAETVIEFLLDLLRIGKLTWRPVPLPARPPQ